MKILLSRIILLLLISLLASCSDENEPAASSAEALASKINMSKLPGWKGQGGEGLYLCVGTSACRVPKGVMYRAVPSNEAQLEKLRNVDKDPKAAEQEFKKVLSSVGGDYKVNLHTVGIMSSGELSGIKGTGFFLDGKKANGSPADPGYMIIYPGEAKVHVFFGMGKSRKVAKADTVLLSKAWTP